MANPIVETICETANIKVEVWDVNGTSHWKLTNPSTGREKVIVGAYEFADLLLGTTYGVPTQGAKQRQTLTLTEKSVGVFIYGSIYGSIYGMPKNGILCNNTRRLAIYGIYGIMAVVIRYFYTPHHPS